MSFTLTDLPAAIDDFTAAINARPRWYYAYFLRGHAHDAAGRRELAILDFVKELYKTRRVSDKTYKKLHGLFGDAGMVELVGICGYYALISMTLNVFRAEIPAEMPLPFKEP